MSASARAGRVFDAATLPLHGLRLIEASAGTGKTFSLAGLYLRLIVEQGASVRDILVMTFTRAATQELRERIRARLADAARIAYAPEQAQPGNAEHAFTQTILARREEDRAALARRLADAAARADEATIVTLHGFAQRAASENAFASALAFDRGEAVDDPSRYREAAADYWREHVFGAGTNAGDVLALWRSPDVLYQIIAPVLSRPHARLVGCDRARLAALRQELASAWPGTAEPLAAALANAFAADALRKDGSLYQALANEEDLPGLIADLDARITAALTADSVLLLPRWVTAFAAVPAQFKKLPKRCQAFAEPLTALPALAVLAEMQPMAELVAVEDAVATVRDRAAARKLARRQYSFDDLIAALHAALGAPSTGEGLAEALYARWPYALVDEFQDTDPLQYASLRRIYLDRPRERGALLLIGDPKQAIYGFRGGDIYAYLAAARAAGGARYTLATNYRSTQGVLDAVEALYQFPGARPFVVPEIDLPPVAAGRRAGDRRLIDTASAGERAALTFWRLQGGETTLKNGKRKNPSKANDSARLVAETVAAIARLLDAGATHWRYADGRTAAVAARDIAVLVNSHREATTVQAALAGRGIMAVCQHRDSVFASEQADDLRLILRAMAAPDDAAAVRAAQPTALLDKRLADLIALADDDHVMQAAVEQFHALHEAWATRGVLAALEELFVAAAPGLLALTDGERRMSNYLQLGELLAKAEAECFGMASVVRWLDGRIATARDDTPAGLEDDSQLRLESDADLVRVATVHAAKGLQYPIVLLPFARWLGTAGRPDKPPLVFHDDGGQAKIDLIGDAPANQIRALTEARSEALRLLYVALTRAEQALIVGWREPDDGGASGALGDLLYRDGAAKTNALDRLIASRPQAEAPVLAIEAVDVARPPPAVAARSPTATETLTRARSDLPRPRPRWSTYSFSRLVHAGAAGANNDLPAPGAEDEPASESAAALAVEDRGELPALDARLAGVGFGSAVHEMLETALQRHDHRPRVKAVDWPRPGAASAQDAHGQVAATLRRYGLIDEDDTDVRITQTVDLVARVLYTPLPGIGPLASLDTAHTRTEMEFMLRLRGHRLGVLIDTLRETGYLPAALGGEPTRTLYGLMQGFIDLVAEVDGAFYILDYKSNRLGDTPTDYRDAALVRAVGRAHYDLQYLIYSVALHRHLRRCLGAAYDPATHLGGVQYLFVRAMDGESETGVYTDRPPAALIEALDTLFDGATETA